MKQMAEDRIDCLGARTAVKERQEGETSETKERRRNGNQGAGAETPVAAESEPGVKVLQGSYQANFQAQLTHAAGCPEHLPLS